MLLTFLFAWQPFVHSEQIKQVEQVKLLLDQIQQQSLEANQSKVYLGTGQIASLRFNEGLSFYITQLIQLLNTAEKELPQNVVSQFQWLPTINGTLPKTQVVNAGLPGQVLTICQATFL